MKLAHILLSLLLPLTGIIKTSPYYPVITANKMAQVLQERLDNPNTPPLEALVYDYLLHHPHGMVKSAWEAPAYNQPFTPDTRLCLTQAEHINSFSFTKTLEEETFHNKYRRLDIILRILPTKLIREANNTDVESILQKLPRELEELKNTKSEWNWWLQTEETKRYITQAIKTWLPIINSGDSIPSSNQIENIILDIISQAQIDIC